MLKKIVLAAVLTLAFVVSGAAERTSAQETEAPKVAPAKTADTGRIEESAYRFDISINELEGGKKVNTRQYSIDVNTAEGRNGDLKIGTRVPIELKQGEIEYFDLGTRISVRIQEGHQGGHNGPAGLSVRAEISSLAVPDQNQGRDSRPILRQFTINGGATWEAAMLGKPLVIGSVDDPDSKRTFQLEVTVTKPR
jgi:hypothetical protein